MITKIKKWEEISRELIFDNFKKIEKVVYRLPHGREADFYIKKEGSPVCVLALTDDNQVITARQFRPGPGEVLHELPGGGREKGESPEEAAARELLEETGYAGKIEKITESYDCAYSTLNRHCFVATGCKKIAEQKLDEHEFVEVVLFSLDEFRKILRSGKMTDVEVGYLGLDYLGLL